MSNRLKAVPVAGLVLMMLVACGGAAATQAPEPTTAEPTASAEPTAAATPNAAAGCSSDATEGEEVAISDFQFQPSELAVAVGTTVAWTNTDSAAHTVTFEGGPDCGSLDEGQSIALEFATAGTFAYVCTFHPNMQATVIVE